MKPIFLSLFALASYVFAAPVNEADVTITMTTTLTTTTCPKICSASHYTSSAFQNPMATTVTKATTVLTTICPVTEVSTHSGNIVTKTYDLTSKITTVYHTTVTLVTSTVTYGSDTIPVTVPLTTPVAPTIPAKYTTRITVRPTKNTKGDLSKSASIPITSSSVETSKPTPSAQPTRVDGPNPYGPSCVPCDGQPGNDPNAFCGYTIRDNSYEHTPQTCVHRKYEFTLQNVTIAPDGIARYVLAINGQVPGPKVEANWGDWISITLHNTLQNNGSSLHMHGFRQFKTNEMDGVPSITQCPVAPGDSITYTFRADNYGTSWYHSHFALQTYEGFFGPVVIHGPTALAYDYEEAIVLSDWSHTPVDQMIDAAQNVGPFPANGPRTLDTGLINGLNTWGPDSNSNQLGKRFVLNVKPNKKYLLRIISASIQATWKFQIDGHKFKVIATDFVPITPYETTILNVNIGQRYDIVLETDQVPGNYWMRSDNQETCGSIRQGKDIKAILRYDGASPVNPNSSPYAYVEECRDETATNLVPVVPLTVGAAADEVNERIFIAPYAPVNPNVFRWTLSNTFFQTEWSNPSLGGIIANGEVPYTGNLVIEAPKLGEWIYIIMDSILPVPHPIHLHGHDFFILAQGPGLYNRNIPLNLNNPPRRDVALMPGSGHLVIAYLADNPGVWLLHCHLGWHNAMGFALQIVEGLDGINGTIADAGQFDRTCRNWNAYASPLGIVAHDAGV